MIVLGLLCIIAGLLLLVWSFASSGLELAGAPKRSIAIPIIGGTLLAFGVLAIFI
jgi:hypothetical protein